MSESALPSGLTVDGVRVPQAIEAEGGEAVTMYVLEQLALAAETAPAVVETAPNPPTFDEGAES